MVISYHLLSVDGEVMIMEKYSFPGCPTYNYSGQLMGTQGQLWWWVDVHDFQVHMPLYF